MEKWKKWNWIRKVKTLDSLAWKIKDLSLLFFLIVIDLHLVYHSKLLSLALLLTWGFFQAEKKKLEFVLSQ